MTAKKIDAYIVKLQETSEGKHLPFTFIIDDPSGNSFIENPKAPSIDHVLKTKNYIRTVEDYEQIGFQGEQLKGSKLSDKRKFISESAQSASVKDQDELLAKAAAYAKREPEITSAGINFSKPLDEQGISATGADDPTKSVLTFPQPCFGCAEPGEVRMCVSSIPFFKEIIIMAYHCDLCGYKNTEIKTGGGISEKATKITFKVTDKEHLNRDIFKSDTAALTIPEVDLELSPGTLGGVYTTVEGALIKIAEHLESSNPFGKGDSK